MKPSHNPLPPLLAAMTLAGSTAITPAWGQQDLPIYLLPPSLVPMPPMQEPNPYLLYVPMPYQAMPQVQSMPAAEPMPAPTTPVPLQEKPESPPTLSEMGKALQGYFTQDELDLLFDYMKESVVAAFKGEEVNLPPDLAFKLEILLVRLKKEGLYYMDSLLKQLEADLKRNLKEKFATPPLPADPRQEDLPPTTPAAMPGGLLQAPPGGMLPAGRRSIWSAPWSG